ncbi:MAG: sugar ABC transporter permease [Desulfobacteraceae bacterium]|jgi:multiple sugar transport system permease protein
MKTIQAWIDQEHISAWLYLAPALILLSIFIFYPTVRLLCDSFYSWDGMGERTFIGIQNYRMLIQDDEFWQTVKNSFVFIVGSVPTGMAISLAMALLIQKHLIGRDIFRTIFFAPVVTSLVAAGLVFVWLLNYDFGVLNMMLEKFGLAKIPWLVNDKYAMLSVIVMTIWKDAGYNMILFLAGLNNISESYYEAARIDGAGSWQMFWKITWPLLMPTTFFILVVRIIFSFRTFEQIYAMTKGGPVGSTTVFVYYIYEKAFKYFEIGYASAAAIALLLIVLVLTYIQFKVVKNENK